MNDRDGSLLGALRSLLRTPIPTHRRGVFAFGWLLLVLLVIQGATGILLSVYYESSAATAAASVRLIMRDVTAGWLVRGIHHWNANLIVGLSALQMLRVLVTGAYRGSARASWTIGCILLVLVFAEAMSGEILPWDNDAFWALKHALDGVERIPVIGHALAVFVRGGADITEYTLSRIHAAHALLLPWTIALLVTTHLWLFARRRTEEVPR